VRQQEKAQKPTKKEK
jgi:hypothetical protein